VVARVADETSLKICGWNSIFSKTVLKVCLAFSVSYNIVGLSFAISGNLTPLIAAILMPISSITVVFISTFLVHLKK
jgi:Cu+-exporting ATPase